MAVLDIPRIHFRGIARVHAPTGANNLFGNIDLKQNAVLIDGRRVDAACPATDFHDYMRTHGTRYDATGEANPQGLFSTAAGWDFGGNGHFSWHETRVTAVQLTAGSVCTEDALVGSYVELWGHYNEYLRTTSNRARWIEIDPSSRWTTQISAGQLTVGRTESTIRTPNLLSAEFDCPHSARWLRCDRVPVVAANVNAWHIGASRLFQFSVPKGRQLGFAEQSGASRALQALKTALEVPEIRGITVQYCVFNMSTPIQPDAPIFYELIGTIGVWRHGELATLPAGRMLVPADAATPLGTASVLIDAGWARFNLANAVPFRNREVKRRSAVHPTHDLGPPFLEGDLELREQNGRLLTTIPERHWTQAGNFLELGGILDTPLEACASHITSAHALEVQMVTHGERRVVLRERDWVLETDQSVLSVESRDVTRNNDHATRVELSSWYRGVPTAVDINIHQYRNPYAAAADSCVVAEINTVEFAAMGSNSPEFSPSCTVRTDANGQGAVLVRGTAPGSARLALTTAKERWWPAGAKGDAVIAYDNANRLRHWECEGQLHIRVLPDDWHLLDVPDCEVTFEYIYKHVLSYYELVYPFMRNAVFSLADPSKCATYARLMWQMCDPQNKSRSYYMPSTRELSYPKALLFRKYLCTVEQSAAVPTKIVTAEPPLTPLGSREALLIALKSAATLELTIMLQYLYAAYSLPSFEAGRNLVAQGQWTHDHLREVCGDGQERYAQGWRGTLLEISHEEMIHYLLINNIITQMGEPFYPAFPAFGVDGLGLGLDTELALEAFSPLVLERFIRLEWPGYFALGVSDSADASLPGAVRRQSAGGQLAAFYARIRSAIAVLPELFKSAPRQGGEHHLFLNELTNRKFPDYQLEIVDTQSALFAIDFITSQGEGVSPQAPHFEVSHFQRLRRIARSVAQLGEQQWQRDPHAPPFCPAYPAIKNPTLDPKPGMNTITNPTARQTMALFAGSFEVMLSLMAHHFAQGPSHSLRRSRLMNAAIDVMTGVMRPLANRLMTLPSGISGKTAGPYYGLPQLPTQVADYGAGCLAVADKCAILARQAEALDSAVPPVVVGMLHWVQEHLEGLATGRITREA